jgi:hypothetical protein
MNNITKSVKVLGEVIEILLGGKSTTTAEKSLIEIKSDIYNIY